MQAMVSTFRELEKVCKALGLTLEQKKNGVLWSGMANGKFARIIIHKHCEGRDLKNGIINGYVKELGFKNDQEYYNYLREIK